VGARVADGGLSVAGRRALAVLRHRTAAFLLAAALLWGGWQAFLGLSAPGRIDAALVPALARGGLVNVRVTLGFAPEDFHTRLFQDYGVVRGVEGPTLLLNRVRTEDVRRIARFYWVRRIAPQ